MKLELPDLRQPHKLALESRQRRCANNGASRTDVSSARVEIGCQHHLLATRHAQNHRFQRLVGAVFWRDNCTPCRAVQPDAIARNKSKWNWLGSTPVHSVSFKLFTAQSPLHASEQ